MQSSMGCIVYSLKVGNHSVLTLLCFAWQHALQDVSEGPVAIRAHPERDLLRH